MVVPIFAPSVYGKICFSDRTPVPASGTTSDVVAELLWTAAVVTTPRAKLVASLRNNTRSNRLAMRSRKTPRISFMSWLSTTMSRASAMAIRGSYGTRPVTKSDSGVTTALRGLARLMPPAPTKTP